MVDKFRSDSRRLKLHLKSIFLGPSVALVFFYIPGSWENDGLEFSPDSPALLSHSTSSRVNSPTKVSDKGGPFVLFPTPTSHKHTFVGSRHLRACGDR